MEDLFTHCRAVEFKRLTLIFHSFELIILLWIIIFLFSFGNVWKALAIGATSHLLLDQWWNTTRKKLDRRAYLLSFRLLKKFSREGVIRKR